VQADQTYVVPFTNYARNSWMYYYPGVTAQGNPIAYIGP
jgi:hypothetical protein